MEVGQTLSAWKINDSKHKTQLWGQSGSGSDNDKSPEAVPVGTIMVTERGRAAARLRLRQQAGNAANGGLEESNTATER